MYRWFSKTNRLVMVLVPASLALVASAASAGNVGVRIRAYRSAEYDIYRRDRDHYCGRHFMTRRDDWKEHRKAEKERWKEARREEKEERKAEREERKRHRGGKDSD